MSTALQQRRAVVGVCGLTLERRHQLHDVCWISVVAEYDQFVQQTQNRTKHLVLGLTVQGIVVNLHAQA